MASEAEPDEIEELRQALHQVGDQLARLGDEVDRHRYEARQRDDDLLVLARAIGHASAQRSVTAEAIIATGSAIGLETAEEIAVFEVIDRREAEAADRGRLPSGRGGDEGPTGARRS